MIASKRKTKQLNGRTIVLSSNYLKALPPWKYFKKRIGNYSVRYKH